VTVAVLESLVLSPLHAIYGVLFDLLPEGAGPGWRLIAFAIVVNLALAPVYQQMESRSRRTRALREKMAREVARMKRHFKGRERYFYIRTVYRHHQYHPMSELFSSADLLIQVLVFATVYRFLVNHPAFAGQPFGPLADLSQPDGLLWGVHALPLLMTAINAGSAIAYVNDRTKRIQAFALGGVFLILLYRSPSGLVLYWTINNLFSLIRTLATKSLGRRTPRWAVQLQAELAAQR
jgi:membrane protein insertase Oxa1/YidC/SpoIIIJ